MKMASELTYRRHEMEVEQPEAQALNRKPIKPWFVSIRPVISYMLREQRLLFVLVGIAIATLAFTILSPSSNQPIPNYSDPISGSSLSVQRKSSIEYITGGGMGSVGGKIPLGLKRKGLRVVVTGGAGFVGSHLVDRLMARGDNVIVVDNFFTGSKENVMHHFGNPNFELIRHDVVEPILLEVDQIYHLACPASPVHYKFNPVKTIKTNVVGTLNMLGLAKRVGARFLLTSTSEVYGDPLQHPQVETYWGNVNPIGVRSCYDEGKRTAETLAMDYHRGANVEVRIARIFNTYGPRMCIDDGRVVSNFVAQALRKEPLTVYGDGKQTRSFQFVSDLVEGLMRLMEGEHVGPFNLGNPGEFTMLELAKVVQETIDPNAKIEFRPNTEDDPHKRKPDITKAKELLGWEPKVALRQEMGFMVDTQKEGGEHQWSCIRNLVRRKQVDSSNGKAESHHNHHQLAKALTFPHLIAVGVGSTIGAGVYILVGTVAREHSGPALAFSFLIAGVSAALSAFCYAELSSRFPSAGSAYHYSYICIGEGVAWLIGWALILEYTIGGSTVARGISPNLAMIFGGEDCLPAILARHQIPGLDIVVDPCAAVLVFTVTGLLCIGVKESTFAQGIITTVNVFVMIFVIVAGSYLCFKTGWAGYQLPSGYFPYGVDGMLAGSATVFFAYIGFDSVASMAEEVKNPQRDLPLGIGLSLLLCCLLYMMVSVVIVGLVPYYAMDPDTPISSAFATHGIQWAAYLIALGAVMALCSTLMGSILPQPRILMAMARDGLLPSFFSDVNQRTQVPVKGTISTGFCAALLAFFMDVSQLAGMVSVGTLVAFTMVAISVLILRYVPPDEVPLPSSLQERICSAPFLRCAENSSSHVGTSFSTKQPLLCEPDDSTVEKKDARWGWVLSKENRRKFAGWSIMFICIGNFLISYAASSLLLPGLLRYSLCGVGGLLLLSGLIVLSCIDQDDARHSFGHSGGFICPLVPLLPILCILINMYLLVNLGAGTWARVSVWLFIGVLVYVFYGRRHSSLANAFYVTTAHADEIGRSSGYSLA